MKHVRLHTEPSIWELTFWAAFALFWAFLIIAILFLLPMSLASAHDDGRYAQSLNKKWFDSLHSKKGFCCSTADGRDTEYDMREGAYWVPIDGVQTRVPDDAVITEPNKVGHAMIWLTYDRQIRCFIPGAGL